MAPDLARRGSLPGEVGKTAEPPAPATPLRLDRGSGARRARALDLVERNSAVTPGGSGTRALQRDGGYGSVVVGLPTGPALTIGVAEFGSADFPDERGRPVVADELQGLRPVGEMEAVDQAGRAVAEHGEPGDVGARDAPGERWGTASKRSGITGVDQG